MFPCNTCHVHRGAFSRGIKPQSTYYRRSVKGSNRSLHTTGTKTLFCCRVRSVKSKAEYRASVLQPLLCRRVNTSRRSRGRLLICRVEHAYGSNVLWNTRDRYIDVTLLIVGCKSWFSAIGTQWVEVNWSNVQVTYLWIIWINNVIEGVCPTLISVQIYVSRRFRA